MSEQERESTQEKENRKRELGMSSGGSNICIPFLPFSEVRKEGEERGKKGGVCACMWGCVCVLGGVGRGGV